MERQKTLGCNKPSNNASTSTSTVEHTLTGALYGHGNMFCTELRIHRRYDLKGSSQGRYTDKDKIDSNTTLKDLDLSYEFHMDKSLRKSLFQQISLDCMFLESQQIIDYSLLLGLHFSAPEHLKTLLELPETNHSHGNNPGSDGSYGNYPFSI
ncbi:Phosphatidylinositol 4-phosphate 5-kinase 8 [Vitis vinifera]|uniref:1-phosphatidylinositol-4-phosphate 5-kinase n=1 Tax=Vitis vinifera TaxID=29760 RepID=A0A438CMU7_VITVI|nr:Phosphatidylinositol 4-phosphate 5-kinase 8 [Vitis vinifera]